ncbi:30S ribosomal protein S18 [Candidatus Berkelbacteria bacterium RIFCSPLOWO2_01_FULL_50_28]|uniref:Small ribosomal subunit protein bS18 n=1 Tax=Candidatus Berkelbacteria bacterium RIFCSPLOWO2_01_FULL_50_28 TaxID=1797471 RepID=A0A1F5EBC6_9BACT|nr:MAG: 30S ribosomal protein S18 [Candidatus Berkelbacteria bacterium RIFCSPHIGHO2_01_FULL_50_36]OGD62109.1 MAG: 30S ribosomal protein S18 [Candidatus Berkelbacteria bacterium RIFCSPHIGHO2_12_FULL_50_11]OGD64600.1 MAG: 30S ribosomal protein S18 [Candidatus Berkelbacteria bacterium RIFCSPLOWO2_01_FULL_50_28]
MKRRIDCYFAKNQVREIDYRDTELLSRYLTGWGKLKSARETNTSSKYQRQLSVAVKRARFLGLLPLAKR